MSMLFTFTGDFAAGGLSSFTDIKMIIGAETYTTTLNPNELYTVSNLELRLNIGLVTALTVGCYAPELIGFVNGTSYELTGTCKPVLGSLSVC